jgi:thiopeptide-type bacteriocin biosynthesis protein
MLRHRGFFGLRTPLLPVDELWRFSEGLEAAAALGDPARLEEAIRADRVRLRARLGALIERPDVREALFVASAELEAALERWRADPDGRRGRKVEAALVRYLARMTTRATPVGLLAGSALGTIGPTTRLRLEARDRYRRRTRVAMEGLRRLAASLARDPATRATLTCRPNPTAHRAAGRLRYLESVAGHQRLVSVDDDDALALALARAEGGARQRDLAAAVAEGCEVTLEDAAAFVEELIEAQLLVSDELEPPVTGDDPIEAQIRALDAHGQPAVADRLRAARDHLAELDRGLGNPPARYRALAAMLPAEAVAGTPRVFDVDLWKPAPACRLGEDVVAEIVRGVELLHRLHPPGPDALWRRFQDAFAARYGQREVPLLEALERIGFSRRVERGPGTPLLAGLDLEAGPTDEPIRWRALHELLLAKLEAAWEAGAEELRLEDDELARVAADAGAVRPLPAALSAMVTILAASDEAVARGELRVALTICAGPSGVRQLGRVAALDDELRRHVEAHLREEEAGAGDAVLAEIVHLPAGKRAATVSRPALRAFEIVCSGRPSAAAAGQIPAADLLLSLCGGRLILRSRRLGRRVLPRLSAADNFKRDANDLYAFLCEYQAYERIQWLFLHLGPLGHVRRRPRIVAGRVILVPATWQLDRAELRALDHAGAADRFRAVQALRSRRGLPRWIALSEIADTELVLPIDLDNTLAVDAFVARVRRRETVSLREVFLGEADLCATAPEGRFSHELVLPLVSTAPPAAMPAPGGAAIEEWLEVRVAGAPAEVDQLLAGAVPRLIARAIAARAADRWAFHRGGRGLILRLRGAPAALAREVLAELGPGPLADGAASGLSLETQHADVALLGGAEPAALAARIAHADSDAAAEIVAALPADRDLDDRLRVAVVGADGLLASLGLAPEERLRLVERLRRARSPGPRAGLARLFRAERATLEALLDPDARHEPARAAALAALRRRGERLAGLAGELQALAGAGQLPAGLEGLARDHLEAHVGRLVRTDAPGHALVVADLLARLYAARRARARSRG